MAQCIKTASVAAFVLSSTLASCTQRVEVAQRTSVMAAALPVPVPVPESLTTSSAPSSGTPAPSTCPEGTLLISGDYCPEVEHRCLEWLDPPGNKYSHFRCVRYAKPAVCKSKAKRAMRFCMEAVEHREEGSDLPMHGTSWTDATRICKAQGGRLCTAAEWQFACEGEEMRPYPYGWERDSSRCNVDVTTGLGRVGRLVDHRAPRSAFPECVSAFGVHGMAGNVDEWVTIEGYPVGKREVMKGSWWLPGKHFCRAEQAGHGASYGGTETGVRCCFDAK